MKAWYDDIDAATLQRIKTYSAFDDATSKNLMIQTMYEYREKEIQDFKETNHELAETCIARKKRIAELEAQIEKMKCCENCRWEEPSSFCDGCKRLKGQIFSDVITNDNWELRRYKNA